MATLINIEITRGDDRDLPVTIELSGAPVNLTGATLRFSAKWKQDDVDGAAVFTRVTGAGIVHTNPAAGQATVSFIPANTSGLPAHRVDLYYDLQLTTGAGKVYTVMAGRFFVVPDVSVTTP